MTFGTVYQTMPTIRINAIFENASDGISFYRGAGPLFALRKQMRNLVDLQITQPHAVDWSVTEDSDIMFMIRPCHSKHVTVAKIASLCRVPLWVDYDDDLLNVTPDNPTWEFYGDDKIQSNLKRILEIASVVTVSTESIKKTLSPYSDSVVVIPNAWNDSLRPFDDPPENRIDRCIWRGTATHIQDLMDVSEGMFLASDEFPKWRFSFMGWNPWFVASRKQTDRIDFHPKQDVLPYLDTLRSLSGKIVFVPLADTTFNRGKSSCAFLEASYAGCAVLAPDFREWDRPGITIYHKSEFGEYLREMMRTPWPELKKRVDASRDYIKDNLLLSKVNSKRQSVIDRLLDGSLR